IAVLIEVDDGPDRIDFGGSIHLAIAAEDGVESRRSRIYGGRDWVRLGAVELGLDCLRRYLQGLPVSERTDFERVGATAASRMLRMSTRNTKTVTISLPPQLVAELDRVREREHRTRSEILSEA